MAVGAVTYLCNRVYRSAFVSKKTMLRTDRKLRVFECVTVVLVAILVLCLSLGYINAVIMVIHLVVFWLLSDLLFYVIEKVRKSKFKYNFASMTAVVVTVVYLAVGWALAHTVSATCYDVYTDKAVGDLRVVMFGDSHIGSTFDGNGFAEHVKKMQAYKPDIVVIAGDFADDDTSRDDLIKACRALGTLKTTYGVYYAFGNHDKGYYSDSHRSYTVEDLVRELEKNSVTILQDEVKSIDDRFYIIGRQEAEESRRGKGPRADIDKLVSGLEKDKYKIVINHQPTDYDSESKAGVDLVLSGHTHGGQLFPIGVVSDMFGLNDRVYGHERRRGTDFIVTSGISDWAIGFKTGCYSEFVVIDIHGR